MKTLKQFQPKLLATAVLIGLCMVSGSAFAAKKGGNGGGSGGGGVKGEVLGDLVVLLRDSDGVPVLTPDKCQQPLAAPGVPLPAVPPILACTPPSPTESCTIPVDPTTCAVIAGYETYLQAVDFARMSVARSPASVMDKQMADVLVNLSTAQCTTLDPAGRLVHSNWESALNRDLNGDGDTADLISSAVDSPLQSLAIYRELITKGALGTPPIQLPVPFGGYGILDTAAKSLGAASDKGGKIDVDLVVYLNQILGLDKVATQLDPKICIDIRQEVQGKVQTVNKCFLNYRTYDYSRTQTYGNLPFPKNIPAASPQLGYFDYLTLYSNGSPPLFFIDSASIVPTVFLSLPGFLDGNIGGFAQAGDDARAVIDFMHSHPVLAGYEAPVICDSSAPSYADVSSKLQMPINMVANTAREGTLTVDVKGATVISGSVTVTGIDSRGQSVPVVLDSDPAFEGSKSWTVSFTGPSYATTITWTATATADNDNNLTNNIAIATTTVLRSGKTK
jgi:hypothetical protein